MPIQDTTAEMDRNCPKCFRVQPFTEFRKRYECCKQCERDRAKAQYRNDPAKSKAHRIQWAKDHPERIREFSRAAYRKAHPESRTMDQVRAEMKAKSRRSEKPCKRCGIAYPMDNFGISKTTADGRLYQCKQCMAIKGRARYASNPELLEKGKLWNKAHPEANRHTHQKRRARKNGIPGSHTLAQWIALCAKFRNRCVRCGAAKKLTRDHIVPISRPNSSHDISNIQPLCYSCNSSKNNRFSVDYRATPFIGCGQELLF